MNLTQVGERLAGRFQAVPRSPRRQRLLLLMAFVIFVTAAVVSYRQLPEFSLDWRWILLLAAVSPLTLLIAGMEYQLSGRILGHAIPFFEAFRIGIMAIAANLLPVPGSVLVRTQALKSRGSGYADALISTAAVGVGWVGITLVAASAVQLVHGRIGVTLLFGLPGLAGLGLTAALLKIASDRIMVPFAQILAVEGLLVLLAAVRLYAALEAIGIDATITQAVTLTIAASLASAAGVFPGGLGLREIIAGVLSPLASLSVAGGVLAAAVDRLIGLIVIGIGAAVLFARSGADD
jgi:uncharacterized membrane protein YbhN (UPF0104 family)